MPLYEYVCRDCDADFETLVASSRRDESLPCPRCAGHRVARKVSLAARPVVHAGSASPSESAFDCGAPGGCCGGACGLDE